jgi:hypothetical protein
MFILSIALLAALVGSLPTWPHSKKWGYLPIGVISVVMVIVLILFATGHLRAR